MEHLYNNTKLTSAVILHGCFFKFTLEPMLTKEKSSKTLQFYIRFKMAIVMTHNATVAGRMEPRPDQYIEFVSFVSILFHKDRWGIIFAGSNNLERT